MWRPIRTRIPPTAYANQEGQLRIALATPFEAGRTFEARVVYAGTPPLAKRPPWEGGTTWTRTPDGASPWIDTSLWGGGCDLLYPCLDHPTLHPFFDALATDRNVKVLLANGKWLLFDLGKPGEE